jgi:hypothetical protein|tara:strand:+ start:15681 stop:16022 length:342 start_codon:yes stop_codon:yes gene_type:complete
MTQKVHTNRIILANFIGSVCNVVSEGTSDRYAIMILNKFNKSVKAQFPLVKYIHIRHNKVNINKEINSIDSKVIAKYIKKIMSSLFSHLFMRLVKRELDVSLLHDLQDIGVKI